MSRRRSGRRQVIQKFVESDQSIRLTGAEPFDSIKLVTFDEEVIVKRIVSSIVGIMSDPSEYAAVHWSIIQADTEITPSPLDTIDGNRVIIGGLIVYSGGFSQPADYDHTITMRKLSNSAVYLCFALKSASSLTGLDVYAYSQLHYLED